MYVKPYHSIHELNAALQLRPGVTVLTEQEPADGLLLTQTGVVPLWEGKRGVRNREVSMLKQLQALKDTQYRKAFKSDNLRR